MAKFKYAHINQDGNMIGSEGVLHLSKAPFKNLKDIGFGDFIIKQFKIWLHAMEHNG